MTHNFIMRLSQKNGHLYPNELKLPVCFSSKSGYQHYLNIESHWEYKKAFHNVLLKITVL